MKGFILIMKSLRNLSLLTRNKLDNKESSQLAQRWFAQFCFTPIFLCLSLSSCSSVTNANASNNAQTETLEKQVSAETIEENNQPQQSPTQPSQNSTIIKNSLSASEPNSAITSEPEPEIIDTRSQTKKQHDIPSGQDEALSPTHSPTHSQDKDINHSPETSDASEPESPNKAPNDETTIADEIIEKQHSTGAEDSSESPDIPNVVPSEQNKIKRSLQENPWVFLHAYVATYELSADGDVLGNATRKMIRKDDYWQLQISSKLSKWLLTLKSLEYSRFKIKEQKMFTDEFYSKTKVSFRKDKLTKQTFDWEAKQEVGVRGKRTWNLPLEAQVFDRTNHLLKLRSDILTGKSELKYLVSYKGLREFYEYELKGEETIKTPFGEYQTLRVERVSGDDSSFALWLSPDLNYFPVKIAQYEQDKPDVTMTLKDLEFTAAENSLKLSKKEK